MRVLILGGTKYLGRHLAEQALQAGHDVTLFNRGRTGTELFPGVPSLIGDRTADGDPAGLTALGTGSWDTVFDFSGFHPRQVAATARLLAPRIGQYVFVSSIAVYPASAKAGRTEDAPLLPPEFRRRRVQEFEGRLRVGGRGGHARPGDVGSRGIDQRSR